VTSVLAGRELEAATAGDLPATERSSTGAGARGEELQAVNKAAAKVTASMGTAEKRK
jgi:hypothetical protein